MDLQAADLTGLDPLLTDGWRPDTPVASLAVTCDWHWMGCNRDSRAIWSLIGWI
jgi:hypothetical protein